MNTSHLDNSDNGDILRSILWQYEHANNVVGVIEMMKCAYDATTKDFYDALLGMYDLASATVSDFGLTVWGIILSCPRPALDVGGDIAMASSELYRRLLLAKLRLLDSDSTMESYQSFCDTIFGDGNVSPHTSNEMDLTFSTNSGVDLSEEEEALLAIQKSIFPYPSGVKTNEHSESLMFGLDGQQNNLASSDPQVGGFDESGFCWRYTNGGRWN